MINKLQDPPDKETAHQVQDMPNIVIKSVVMEIWTKPRTYHAQ